MFVCICVPECVQLPGSETLNSYDMVAVQPCDEESFLACCASGCVDIITFALGARLPFQLKEHHVRRGGCPCLHVCMSVCMYVPAV